MCVCVHLLLLLLLLFFFFSFCCCCCCSSSSSSSHYHALFLSLTLIFSSAQSLYHTARYCGTLSRTMNRKSRERERERDRERRERKRREREREWVCVSKRKMFALLGWPFFIYIYSTSAFVELNMESTFCESGKLDMSFPCDSLKNKSFLYLSYKEHT